MANNEMLLADTLQFLYTLILNRFQDAGDEYEGVTK